MARGDKEVVDLAVKDLEFFLLYVIRHAQSRRPFSQARLMAFTRDANAAERMPWDIKTRMIEDVLRRLFSEGKVYSVHRMSGGVSEEHLLIARVGIDALVAAIREATVSGGNAVDGMIRYANRFFDLRRQRRRS